MSLLEEAKLLLRRHRIFPKKSFGQNFMVDSSMFPCLVEYASLNQNDVVLDIGAGLGFLTSFLAERCKNVVAVEADGRLVQVLREQLSGVANIQLIHGNVLEVIIPTFNKVVSFPPYGISSPLLSWLFGKDFDCAALIFQKEFAGRMVAPVGSEDYGWLTVVTYYYMDVELLDDVPRWMFYPQPEVDSVVVRLRPRKPHPFTLEDEALFTRLVQVLFTRRNRKVKNAVSSFVKDPKEAVKFLPFFDRRARELAPEDFGALANALSQ
jgi:16S rRNA (adenine1518-N6/adenine1519-N6)-dimethyltransferase